VGGETEARNMPLVCPEGVAGGLRFSSEILPLALGRLAWDSAKEATCLIPEPSAHWGNQPPPRLPIKATAELLAPFLGRAFPGNCQFPPLTQLPPGNFHILTDTVTFRTPFSREGSFLPFLLHESGAS